MPKNQKTFYEILNKSADTKSVDILIYGSIPSWEEDGWKLKNTCDLFLKEFKNLEKDYDRINIRINSPGGSLYHAFPIFNAIISSKKDIHTYNDGMAASAGGVLLLAGKTVHSAKNGMLMIHNALNWMYGNAQELRDCAEVLDKYDEILAEHFADKSGKPVAEIKAAYFSYKDKWLTASEALAEGFINVIEDYESEDAPPENITNMSMQEVMAMYNKPDKEEGLWKKITNHIREAINSNTPPITLPQEDGTSTAATAIPAVAATTTESPTTLTPDMDFKNSLAVLDKASPTAEELATIRAEITAFTGANEKFTPEEVQNQIAEAKKPLEDQVSNLTTEKDNLQAQVGTLTNEKTAIATEKTNLATENTGLKADIEAYRASGVKPTNSKGADPDPIDGDEHAENFYCEADEEVKKTRASAGLAPATK